MCVCLPYIISISVRRVRCILCVALLYLLTTSTDRFKRIRPNAKHANKIKMNKLRSTARSPYLHTYIRFILADAVGSPPQQDLERESDQRVEYSGRIIRHRATEHIRLLHTLNIQHLLCTLIWFFRHTNLHTYHCKCPLLFGNVIAQYSGYYMCETRNNRWKWKRKRRWWWWWEQQQQQQHQQLRKKHLSILADLFRVFTKICVKQMAEESFCCKNDHHHHCCCCCLPLFRIISFIVFNPLFVIVCIERQPTTRSFALCFSLAYHIEKRASYFDSANK